MARRYKLSLLIVGYRNASLSLERMDSFTDQTSKLIAFRLNRRWRRTLRDAWINENSGQNWRDIFQDSWVEVMKTIHDYDSSKGGASSWVCVCVDRVVMRHVRQARSMVKTGVVSTPAIGTIWEIADANLCIMGHKNMPVTVLQR